MSSYETFFEGLTFERMNDRKLPGMLTDAKLSKCRFLACDFGSTAKSTSERRRISNVNIVNCKATNNSSLGPVFLEDIEIDAFQTAGLCIAWGTAFRRVRFRGRCGKFMLSPLASMNWSKDLVARFDADNRRFYAETDWALDISEAEFEEMDMRNVPADLVRRDPETQVIVRRSQVEATQEVWRKLDLAGTPWPIALSNMLHFGWTDTVLVAPKRRKDFGLWRAGLQLLQREGVAETD